MGGKVKASCITEGASYSDIKAVVSLTKRMVCLSGNIQGKVQKFTSWGSVGMEKSEAASQWGGGK